MFGNLLDLLRSRIIGPRAWEDAAAIHSMDRQFTFASFHDSARYSAERLRAAGVNSVEIIEAPADGRSVYGDWMMPLAWEAEGATFDVIPPGGAVERVADRSDTPACLAMWSAPTPAEGTEGELIWAGNPSDRGACRPQSVSGKIVFTSADPRSVKRACLDSGALGFLSDFQSPGADLPDAVAWVNAWSDDPGGWALTHRDRWAWSFQVSPRQGARLRARLESGETLRGRAVVRTSLGTGTLPAVTGVIPGSGREEVLLLGHQFEQGAWDNAAGIGIMLEAARALQSLISEGRLPTPQRSIRFLFVSECYGTMHWAETRPSARRAIAGLCIDAVCGDLQLATKPLEVSVSPDSQATCADAVILALAREVLAATPTYPWRETPFAMGTDNNINDILVGIPCPWIGSHSRVWHTSADAPEVVDAEAQQLVARMAAAYAYLLASADSGTVLRFAYLTAARAKAALAEAGVAELADLLDLDDAMQQMGYLARRHAERVGSVLTLLPPADRARIRPQVRALQRQVRRAGEDEAASLARHSGRAGCHAPAAQLDATLMDIHPRRLVAGPLTFDRLAPEDRGGRRSPRWSAVLFSVLNWCDGRRSLAEACHLAARELRRGRTLSPDELAQDIDPSTDSMAEYFEFLRRHGYVSW